MQAKHIARGASLLRGLNHSAIWAMLTSNFPGLKKSPSCCFWFEMLHFMWNVTAT